MVVLWFLTEYAGNTEYVQRERCVEVETSRGELTKGVTSS